jgi:hypothetical protein
VFEIQGSVSGVSFLINSVSFSLSLSLSLFFSLSVSLALARARARARALARSLCEDTPTHACFASILSRADNFVHIIPPLRSRLGERRHATSSNQIPYNSVFFWGGGVRTRKQACVEGRTRDILET